MSFGTVNSTRELGEYELLSLIAEGGMGSVYKGRHKSTQQFVAIKVIPPETARQPVLLRRFEQEFRAASLIDHPNVVRALDYCGSPPTPFLVMEFVDGKSLGERIEKLGPFREEDAVHLIAQVCEGLHRAHKQGLIHRDVKPDNILLTHDGVAKLTDLGLVKDVDGEENLTRTGKGLGTPHYMAPEQFRNAKNADVRCDVYSLGATLYTLLTGKVPFAGTSPLDCWIRKSRNEFPTPKSLAPELSDRVDFAIRRAMAAGPADRPASCREFMEDVTGLAWRPGQSASLSESRQTTPAEGSTIWYMVVYDEREQPKTVKGTTETIRRNIQTGTLGDLNRVLVCRSKSGPFAPLRSIPEFRDLVFEDALVSEGPKSGIRSGPVLPGLATPSRTRLNPPSSSRIASPTRSRLNPPTVESGEPDAAKSVARRPSPNETTPLPKSRELGLVSENDQTFDARTDEVSAVPYTDQETLNLETAERPRLPLLPSQAGSSGRLGTTLFILAIALTAGAAALVAHWLTR